MSYIKLKNEKMLEVAFAFPGEIVPSVGETIDIGVISDNFSDVETDFDNGNAEKVVLGNLLGEGESAEFDILETYTGFSQIYKMSKERNFNVGQDRVCTLIRVQLCKPVLREEVKKANNDIMLALTDVYEMLLAQEV